MPDDATPETVPNRRGLADIFGLSDVGRISKYVASGMPVRSDGGFDVAACISWRSENVGKTTLIDHRRLIQWRTAHEKQKTKLCRLKCKHLENSVVDVATAYDIFRPAIVSMGILAQAFIDTAATLPPNSPIQNATMKVIEDFSAIQEYLGQKIANAPTSTPVPNRFERIASKLGITL